MASMQAMLKCIGVNKSGRVSVLGHFLGFLGGKMPADPDANARSRISLVDQINRVRGPHVHLNVIRVGFNALSGTAATEATDMVDYAVYKIRNIYRTVGLGVGRIEHYEITAAQSNGRDDIGDGNEADALSDEWTVRNNGIDTFVVRVISTSDFVGVSPIGGSCNKLTSGGLQQEGTNPVRDDGLIGGETDRDAEGFARTFAHEIGHYLGLPHNHEEGKCPASTADNDNLMAQTRCAPSLRNSVVLTSAQGTTMRSHCAVQKGC